MKNKHGDIIYTVDYKHNLISACNNISGNEPQNIYRSIIRMVIFCIEIKGVSFGICFSGLFPRYLTALVSKYMIYSSSVLFSKILMLANCGQIVREP